MTTPTTDDLLATWTGRATDRMVGERDPFTTAVLDRLADGLPADAAHLATATGLDHDQVQQRIDAAAATGYETRHGTIVGAALTLNPTPHQFTVRGHHLHTWCGFDALFLPLLLDETATVRSTCPVTGEQIRLTIEPDGTAAHVEPAGTHVAIVGPEVATGCEATGPGSDVCTQMPLLSSARAGQTWLRGRSGVAVVDLDTAMQIAHAYADTC